MKTSSGRVGPRLGMDNQRFCNRGMYYEDTTAMNEAIVLELVIIIRIFFLW